VATNEVDEEKQSEAAIRRTFDDLKTWQERSVQGFRPGPASDLTIDDQDWSFYPTSTVAWTALHSAVDHLNAIRIHIEAKQQLPLAHLTLCRSALIGGAQAVWVLEPHDRDLRLRRTRTSNTYLYKKHLQYLQGLQGLSEIPHENTDKVAAHVDQRLAELAAKRAADGQKEDLNTTDMIRVAAAAVLPDPGLSR
jgi:hypothetical protein